MRRRHTRQPLRSQLLQGALSQSHSSHRVAHPRPRDRHAALAPQSSRQLVLTLATGERSEEIGNIAPSCCTHTHTTKEEKISLLSDFFLLSSRLVVLVFVCCFLFSVFLVLFGFINVSLSFCQRKSQRQALDFLPAPLFTFVVVVASYIFYFMLCIVSLFFKHEKVKA